MEQWSKDKWALFWDWYARKLLDPELSWGKIPVEKKITMVKSTTTDSDRASFVLSLQLLMLLILPCAITVRGGMPAAEVVRQHVRQPHGRVLRYTGAQIGTSYVVCHMSFQ